LQPPWGEKETSATKDEGAVTVKVEVEVMVLAVAMAETPMLVVC